MDLFPMTSCTTIACDFRNFSRHLFTKAQLKVNKLSFVPLPNFIVVSSMQEENFFLLLHSLSLLLEKLCEMKIFIALKAIVAYL